jgi:hypothetical protein
VAGVVVMGSDTVASQYYARTHAGMSKGAMIDSIGVLAVAHGGSGANLSATGGTGYFVKQLTTGAGFSIGQIGKTELPASDVAHWDTAYAWGNHATRGYVTSLSTSPITWGTEAGFGLAVGYGLGLDEYGNLQVSGSLANWDSAYAWGNHADYNYATKAWVDSQYYLTSDALMGYITQGVLDTLDYIRWSGFQAWLGNYLTNGPLVDMATTGFVTGQGYLIATDSAKSTWTNMASVQEWVNEQYYLTSDALMGYVTTGMLDTLDYIRWSGFQAWLGNYLTNGPLVDMATTGFVTGQGYLVATDSAKSTWHDAYAWGNHANAGYLTSSSGLTTSMNSDVVSIVEGYSFLTAPYWNSAAASDWKENVLDATYAPLFSGGSGTITVVTEIDWRKEEYSTTSLTFSNGLFQ